MNTQGQAPGAKAFESKVTEAGGRVDFVFGEEAPFEQCHASTIAQAANGDLVCAFFAGTEEKDPDVGIWMSRFSGGAWSPVERVAKINDTAHWNPVLFADADKALHLFFKVGPEIDYWQTYWMSSTDNGVTWSEAAELVAGDQGGRGPVKNKPIVLSDGTWLAGASTELGRWLPFADRSSNQGKTWERSDNFAFERKQIRGEGAIQPTVWESGKGSVHALMRTSGGAVWRADSSDFGKTWSHMYRTDLPNNHSGIDALGMEDDRVFLVYNPVSLQWGPRTPLDLAVSWDNGLTWTTKAQLEDDPNLESEYSYPAIIRTESGIAICYTWNRKTVRCWQIPLDVLKVD
ncbi:MAG: exo-alpha-sialidase [Candidatus Hydrogenedentes bacterium]|nr:exo-alpha-sialidase [Candidatus Hydrogenedentota bacterium]